MVIDAQHIKQLAKEFGFSHCGIAPAQYLADDAHRLTSWLNNNMHGSMKYMENHFDMRVDPTKLVDRAKSVITMLYNYFPDPEFQQPASSYHVSKYAWGNDYHEVIREKLKKFLQALQKKYGQIQGRGFVDSAPVLERAWAVKSGLGWVGKNGNIIHPKLGSFHFIAVLIVDIDIQHDQPFATDHCGTCSRCIDACPTQAILPNKVINGASCISYYTIELKETFIQSNANFNNWIFGCDICQDVCPWNKFSSPHQEPLFNPSEALIQMSQADWQNLTEEVFKKIFSQSPIKRTKYKGIMRNISFVNQQAKKPST